MVEESLRALRFASHGRFGSGGFDLLFRTGPGGRIGWFCVVLSVVGEFFLLVPQTIAAAILGS
jgi:hypothetical protein